MAVRRLTRVLEDIRRATLHDAVSLSDGQLLNRFIEQQDEAAFAALIQRHSAMVWGVCRRVLAHHHDAEDAFQATFLVLARKAAFVRQREIVANWLHGVAHRTALKAKAITGKRRTREKQVMTMPEPEAVQQDSWPNLESLIDQELAGLPDNYRIAIVLCDLEGKTGKDVARQLKISEGTLASRLRSGRVMLAKRLARHGLVHSGGALAAVLSQNAAAACAPPAVVSVTIKTATLVAAGKTVAAGMIPANVAALTENVVKAMFLTKLKIVMAALLLISFCGLVVATGSVVDQIPNQHPAARKGTAEAGPIAQPSAQPDRLPSIQTILRAWENHAARIQSGRFVWTNRQEMPRFLLNEISGPAKARPKDDGGTLVSQTTCTLIFDGKKTRFEMRGDAPSRKSPTQIDAFEQIFVFDGTTTKEFTPAIGLRKVPQGILFGEKNTIVTHPWVINLMWNLKPNQIIPGISKWEVGSTRDDANDRFFVTLSEPALAPAKGEQRVFWLDPSMEYAIVRCIATERATKKLTQQKDLFLVKDKVAGWIPSGWTISERVAEDSIGTITSKVTKYVVNSGTEATKFEIAYPPGTLVINEKGKEIK